MAVDRKFRGMRTRITGHKSKNLMLIHYDEAVQSDFLRKKTKKFAVLRRRAVTSNLFLEI